MLPRNDRLFGFSKSDIYSTCNKDFFKGANKMYVSEAGRDIASGYNPSGSHNTYNLFYFVTRIN